MTLAPILVQVMTLVPNYDIMIVSSSKLILYGLANQLHSHLLITGMIAVCEVGLSVTNRIEKQDFRMLRFNIFLTSFFCSLFPFVPFCSRAFLTKPFLKILILRVVFHELQQRFIEKSLK